MKLLTTDSVVLSSVKDSTGELYSFRFARDSIILSSYEADAERIGYNP